MVWDSRNAENPRSFVIPLEGDAVNRPGESNGRIDRPTTAAIAGPVGESQMAEVRQLDSPAPMNGTSLDHSGSPMLSLQRMIFGAALLAFTAGCREDGFDLEFHMPVFVTRIELTINQSTGQEPRRVRSGVYAITLDEIGKATLRSSWPIARYHREFVVTPTERLQMPAGYRVVDSGWDMSTVTTRTPWGVTSRSKLDGSVYWMEIARQ